VGAGSPCMGGSWRLSPPLLPSPRFRTRTYTYVHTQTPLGPRPRVPSLTYPLPLIFRPSTSTCPQRDSDDGNQQQYFSSGAPNQDFLQLPGFVPMQLAIDKFILNRTATTPVDPYVRCVACHPWLSSRAIVTGHPRGPWSLHLPLSMQAHSLTRARQWASLLCSVAARCLPPPPKLPCPLRSPPFTPAHLLQVMLEAQKLAEVLNCPSSVRINPPAPLQAMVQSLRLLPQFIETSPFPQLYFEHNIL
jgi:hypothetical protein